MMKPITVILGIVLLIVFTNNAFEYKIINQPKTEIDQCKSSMDTSFHSFLSVCDDPEKLCQDGTCCPKISSDKTSFGCWIGQSTRHHINLIDGLDFKHFM
eukprot:267837_1